MSLDARTLLLAPPVQPTLLGEDAALAGLQAHGSDAFLDIVAAHPSSPLVWALLAEGSLSSRTREGDLSAYAFARTGYHRGLDKLRRQTMICSSSTHSLRLCSRKCALRWLAGAYL